jgi:uncharacterized protein (TIGR02996 family)
MREVLERAILDDPEDPAPFSVYADWLSDQGDPRGEFIQVQLALEDEGRAPAERKRLEQREKQLLEAHQERWLGPLAPLVLGEHRVHHPEDYDEVPNYELRFVRGFLHTFEVHRLFVPVARALRDLPELRFLRELSIGYIETEHDEHVYEPGPDVPTWERDHIQFVSVYPLLGVREFSGLRSLRVGEETDFDDYLGNEYGPSCHTYCSPLAELVEKMPRLRELHALCKSYDLDALFASRALEQLRVLRVCHYGVKKRKDGAYAYPLDILAGNPTFRRLTHLLFHPHHEEWSRSGQSSFLPLEQVEHVLRSPHLQALTHLQLRLSDMGDAGCRAIADCGILERLRSLDLRHGCITDIGARVLAEHPATSRLELLDLGGNGLTEEGVARLAALGDFTHADFQLDAGQIEERVYLNAGDTE